jgi:hypothetical protein
MRREFNGPKLWPCDVVQLLGCLVPFWRGVAALLCVVQCVTTRQSKCQKSDVEAGVS